MLPALSIRQPWAWLILHAGKDVENRDWPTNFRGRMLIHASKTCTKAEYEDAIEFMEMRRLDHLGVSFPAIDQLERGGIVGSVEIVDCVTESESAWFMGHHGFILCNPKPMPFVPFKGRLGFFNVPEDALKGGAA